MAAAWLRLVVFLAGALTLTVELAAARLFAPHFGTSLPVWANLIGLVLAYLALGSWLGGRIAGRGRPEPTDLSTDASDAAPHSGARAADSVNRPAVSGIAPASRVYLAAGAAGIAAALVPAISAPLLGLASRGVAGMVPSLVAGSFLGAALVLALPTVLLGMVVPLGVAAPIGGAVPPRETGGQDGGRETGTLLALSTMGGIAGVFAAALLAIPLAGTWRTFVLGGCGLALVCAAGLWRADRRRALVLGALSLLVLALAWGQDAVPPPGRADADSGDGAGRRLWSGESAYHYIEVRQAGATRTLWLDEGGGLQSVYTPGRPLTGHVWDDLLIAPLLAAGDGPPDVRHALIIGLGGGTSAHGLAGTWSPARIDGVEIDPGVLRAAERYFDIRAVPGLVAQTADGRAFVQRQAADARYDLILVDAYRGPYPPFHLTTVEFFRLLRARLAPGGVVALNVVHTGGPGTLADAVGATLAAVFDTVWVIERPDAYNRVLVATLGAPRPDVFEARRHDLAPGTTLAQAAASASGRLHRFHPPADAVVLTDDHAPVEHLVDRMILRELLSPTLPTLPVSGMGSSR